jgi:hypothetical protein
LEDRTGHVHPLNCTFLHFSEFKPAGQPDSRQKFNEINNLETSLSTVISLKKARKIMNLRSTPQVEDEKKAQLRGAGSQR